MAPNKALNAYRQSEKTATVHPVKLIHMMFERVLLHLEEVEVAIREGDPRKRGENLGRAIAIITELSASIKSDDESEAAVFLRGLYNAILLELPKVSLKKDMAVIDRSAGYLRRLKEIWEETAMREHDLVDDCAVCGGMKSGTTAGCEVGCGDLVVGNGQVKKGLSVSI